MSRADGGDLDGCDNGAAFAIQKCERPSHKGIPRCQILCTVSPIRRRKPKRDCRGRRDGFSE